MKHDIPSSDTVDNLRNRVRELEKLVRELSSIVSIISRNPNFEQKSIRLQQIKNEYDSEVEKLIMWEKLN